MKEPEVLLTQWAEDKIEFNGGGGPQWVNQDHILEMHNAITNRDWEPPGKSAEEVRLGDWDFTYIVCKGVTMKVADRLMENVQKLYRHGVYGRLTLLDLARFGGLGEMHEVGLDRFNEKHRKWREQYDPTYEGSK